MVTTSRHAGAILEASFGGTVAALASFWECSVYSPPVVSPPKAVGQRDTEEFSCSVDATRLLALTETIGKIVALGLNDGLSALAGSKDRWRRGCARAWGWSSWLMWPFVAETVVSILRFAARRAASRRPWARWRLR